MVDDEEKVHGRGTADDGKLKPKESHLKDDLKGNLKGGRHCSVDEFFLDLSGQRNCIRRAFLHLLITIPSNVHSGHRGEVRSSERSSKNRAR